jgi:cyanobactin maturation PatA/PatG family protease
VAAVSNIDRVPGLRDLQGACRDASRISIAVIDGPVDIAHPALTGASLDLLTGVTIASEAPRPSRAHGTHVASVLFGRPDGPVAGAAPNCRGLLIPIFSDSEDGGIRPCSEFDLARALMLACERGANIINISAGRLSGSGVAGAHLEDAVRHCLRTGALLIAAAGNDGCDCMQVPAALPGVLVVGAMDENGEPVGFSNWGRAYRDRGVLAPGTNIIGAAAGGEVSAMTGTSFATPLVAGTAALLMATLLERRKRPDAALVMDAIVAGADRCDPAVRDQCERFLAGTLNVAGALRYLQSKTPTVTSSRAQKGNQPIICSDNSDKRTGSEAMQQTNGDEHPVIDGDTISLRDLAASLKSIETAVGDLGRAFGALQLSGLAPGGIAEDRAFSDAPPSGAPLGATPAEDMPYAAPRRYGRGLATPTDNRDLIDPAACCDACAAREARQLVFALGKLGYDFGTEARMDSIQTQMDALHTRSPGAFGGRQPSASQPADLVAFLNQAKSVAPAINWTLKLNDTPIYAIRPEGFYVQETYEALVNTLDEQTRSAAAAAAPPPPPARGKAAAAAPPIAPPPVERMSLPGIINGQVELMNGLIIPSVRPALAGMYTWSTEALVEALDKLGATGPNDPGKEGPFNPRDGLQTFLSRVYEELRNVGLSPQDRALNFAATNAYQANDIFVKLRGRNIHIEKFEVVRSPVMRPDSDCWDVKMTFFNPADPRKDPREVYFYTIDVSDTVPVAIGKPRHWTTY